MLNVKKGCLLRNKNVFRVQQEHHTATNARMKGNVKDVKEIMFLFHHQHVFLSQQSRIAKKRKNRNAQSVHSGTDQMKEEKNVSLMQNGG